ncbi:Metal tolerance protein 6 [Glycine soja]
MSESGRGHHGATAETGRREQFMTENVAGDSSSSLSWRLNVKEFQLPRLSHSHDQHHQHLPSYFTFRDLLRKPKKQRKVAEYYKKQERLLEGYNDMDTMTETGCFPGSLTEDEMKQLARSESLAVNVSNAANLVLFAAKVYTSIESRSLAVIASTMDSLLDLLSGFILWFTAYAMRNPNQYHYPIGKKRMQPVGIIVFASVMATLGLQILIESGRQLISKIAVYTINTWAKTVIENVWSLIGRTAPPEFLAKLTYLIWNHHEEVKHIDTVRAYTFGTHYFVEVDIVLPEDMPLNQAHNIGETLQEKLEHLSEVERAFVHIDFEYTHRPEHKMMVHQGEKVFLGGDLNGHVGSVARGFEGVHGGFGLGEMNGEGKSILEFSEALDLSIANTWFKKREEHLITYKSGGTCSQIDFFLIRKSDRKYCLNCKVIPGESLTTQHRVLVMDGEKQGIFQQKIWEGWCGQSQGSANDMWNKMSQEIIKVAKKTLGESRGFGPRGKESWWWNENVQSKVRVKKECFKEWSRCRNYETLDKYKIARNETKKAVSEARAQAFDGLYQALGTRDGERSIYRLAKGRERKTRDLDQVKCVKDEEGKVLVHEKDIKERWKVYFHNLFNDGYGYDSSSLDTREEDRNYKYYRRIQKQEVKEALKRMSNGKAVGPDNIPIEVWKTLGDRGLEWLTELFNEIMRSKRMPEEWRRSTRALETHGFRLSRSKSEYMECKFNKRRRVSNSEVKIGDHIIPQVTRFKYLGSVIQDDGEIEGDVNHRIQAGWMKWRKASGVLCDAKVPIKLKGKFYRTAVRPAILYGTKCWAVKSQQENKVGVAEMRMLRWMCGKTRQDKIRNEAIRERVGVAPIVEKMVENRLKWFGHVERRPVDSVVRRVDQMERRQTI